MSLFFQKYLGLKQRLTSLASERWWQNNTLVPALTIHDYISYHIDLGIPLCVGRLGAEEASILLWAKKIWTPCSPFGALPVWFFETRKGATNAGIRPRNQIGYHVFANLISDSINKLDVMGVWKTNSEFAMLRLQKYQPLLCNVEDLGPTVLCERHWVQALNNKHLLVVSPFKKSIENQVPRMHEVWKNRGWRFNWKITVVQFPYLIAPGYSRSWQEVYEEIGLQIKKANYDIALLGCGGLGLPLAALAKDSGKIGIHLGGLLQLLFGIYGRRHLEQNWHLSCINDAWVRPSPAEIPKYAVRVEGGCYW